MCDVCVYVFKGVYDLCVIVVMAAGNNVAGPGCVTRHCAHPAPATPAQGMINTGAPAFADIYSYGMSPSYSTNRIDRN